MQPAAAGPAETRQEGHVGMLFLLRKGARRCLLRVYDLIVALQARGSLGYRVVSQLEYR